MKIQNNNTHQISRWKKILYLGGVSNKCLLFFTKNFAVLVKSGSTMSEALTVLEKQAKGKMAVILPEINNKVRRGNPFSEAISCYPKVFSDIYVSLVRIGEQSGTLEENLGYITLQLEKSYELKRKVWGAMMYPAIVLIGAFVLALSISIFVLPKVTKMFSSFSIELPWTTRLLMAVSNFFQNYGIWAVVILVGGVVFVGWFLKLKQIRPVTHWLILHLPIISGLSKNVNLSMFCRTLGILLKSGVTIDDGMNICQQTVANLYYKKFLNSAYSKIKAGETLTTILREKPKLFALTDLQILSVGEKSGTLSDSLDYCASVHETAVDDVTKNMANLLEPLLLIFLGVIVGLVALAIITPLYSITGSIRR